MTNNDLTLLIERARHNDNEAITEIIKRTQNKLYFVSLSYVKKDADAQDVLQNSYIKAFSSLNSLTDDSKFEAWITRIVSNTALDFMKKASNKYDVKFTDMQGDDDLVFDVADEKIENQPELAFSKKETERIVKEIIDSLSDEQRVAVLMYFYDGMTTKEIAEEIGCKEVTVKARIRYAKEKIKESVETIQKRDGIKLYNMAPLPFFLLLLRGYFASGFGVATAVGTAAAASSAATVATTTATTTAKVGTTVASKGILSSAAAKIAIATAVVVGGGATAYVVVNNNKTYDFQPGLYEDANGTYSIQLDNDYTFDWYRDEVDGRYTSYGTYTIDGNKLELKIGEFGDRAGGCTFKIGNGKITVLEGDATECVKGDVYEGTNLASINQEKKVESYVAQCKYVEDEYDGVLTATATQGENDKAENIHIEYKYVFNDKYVLLKEIIQLFIDEYCDSNSPENGFACSISDKGNNLDIVIDVTDMEKAAPSLKEMGFVQELSVEEEVEPVDLTTYSGFVKSFEIRPETCSGSKELITVKTDDKENNSDQNENKELSNEDILKIFTSNGFIVKSFDNGYKYLDITASDNSERFFFSREENANTHEYPGWAFFDENGFVEWDGTNEIVYGYPFCGWNTLDWSRSTTNVVTGLGGTADHDPCTIEVMDTMQKTVMHRDELLQKLGITREQLYIFAISYNYQ